MPMLVLSRLRSSVPLRHKTQGCLQCFVRKIGYERSANAL